MTLISPPLLSQHPSTPPSKSDFSLLLWLNLCLVQSLSPSHFPTSDTLPFNWLIWCACNGPHVFGPALWRNTLIVFYLGFIYSLLISTFAFYFFFSSVTLSHNWPFWLEYFFVSAVWLYAGSFCLLLSESYQTQPAQWDNVVWNWITHLPQATLKARPWCRSRWGCLDWFAYHHLLYIVGMCVDIFLFSVAGSGLLLMSLRSEGCCLLHMFIS